jgi:hypothetical protein
MVGGTLNYYFELVLTICKVLDQFILFGLLYSQVHSA